MFLLAVTKGNYHITTPTFQRFVAEAQRLNARSVLPDTSDESEEEGAGPAVKSGGDESESDTGADGGGSEDTTLPMNGNADVQVMDVDDTA